MGIFKNSKIKDRYFGYLEGIVYALLTIVVIFTNITGPIEVKLVPLVFILGVVGRFIFDRPIITSILGPIVSLCIVYMLGTYSLNYNLEYSLFCFISILIGEVAGMYLIKFFKDKKKKGKSTKDVVALILLTLAGIYLNNYVSGNVFSYLKYKQTIKEYITMTYPNSNNVKIFDTQYVFNGYKYYSFNVKNIDIQDNRIYKFAVYLDNKIIDGYKNDRLILDSKNLKNKFLEDINLSNYTNFDFNIEYSDVKGNITFYITKNVNSINQLELNKFAEDVNNILDSISLFDAYSSISKLNICIEDKNNKFDADIAKTNFYDKEYYINSLDTVFLDE